MYFGAQRLLLLYCGSLWLCGELGWTFNPIALQWIGLLFAPPLGVALYDVHLATRIMPRRKEEKSFSESHGLLRGAHAPSNFVPQKFCDGPQELFSEGGSTVVNKKLF